MSPRSFVKQLQKKGCEFMIAVTQVMQNSLSWLGVSVWPHASVVRVFQHRHGAIKGKVLTTLDSKQSAVCQVYKHAQDVVHSSMISIPPD